MADLTPEELIEARRWFDHPANNTMWLGEWAAEYGEQLLAEVERRRLERP